MLLELASVPQAAGIPVKILDVDADREAKVRYGHKIPVLLLDEELLCHGRLDCDEVIRALKV